MAINKVIYGNDTLIDLTSDTVDSSNLLSGYTAHDRSGASIVGSAVIPTVNDGTLTIQKNGTNVATFSANQSSNTTANILVDELTEVTDNEPYTLRQGKGDMVDMELVGCSFAWNQLVQNGNFANDSSWNWSSVSSKSISNNVATLTFNTSQYNHQIRQDVSIVKNHVYLVSATVQSTSKPYSFRINFAGSDEYMYTGSIATKVRVTSIIKASDNRTDVRFRYDDGTSGGTGTIENCLCIDITPTSSSIADAIYAMEQATAGSGVAFFRQYFPNDYYAYDAGSIQSVNVASRKVIGFNLWDEVTESGIYNIYDANGDGSKVSNASYVRNANLIRVLPNTKYYFVREYGVSDNRFAFYDINGKYLGYSNTFVVGTNLTATFTTPTDASYMAFYFRKEGLGKACVNIWDESKNGTYEPYESHTADFDATKQLRGIPSLVNNKLVYDGDVYTPNGITRKYKTYHLYDFSWAYSSGSDCFYTTSITDAKLGTSGDFVVKAVNSKGYIATSRNNITNLDKSLCMYISSNTPYTMIRDTSYGTDATAFRNAMNGVYLVAELATPTTESAEPYQNPQRADASGTEEFVDYGVESSTRDVSIPCGHNSTYKSSEVIQPLEDYADSSVKSKLQYYEQGGFLGRNIFDNNISNVIAGAQYAQVSGNTIRNTATTSYGAVRYEFVLESGTYTASIGSITNNSVVEVAIYSSGTYTAKALLTSSNASSTFTLSADSTMRLSIYSTTANNPVTVTNVQLERGFERTSYISYIPSNLELDINKINDSDRGNKTFKISRGTSHTTNQTGYWADMLNYLTSGGGSPTTPSMDNKWWHILSMDWNGNGTNDWISQLAIATKDNAGVWWRRNDSAGTNIDSSTWHRLAEGDANGNAIGVDKLYATGSYTSSTSAVTTVTATNANISIDSTTPIEVFTDVFGVNLTNMSVSGSGTSATISITFPKTTSAQTINYRVYVKTI